MIGLETVVFCCFFPNQYSKILVTVLHLRSLLDAPVLKTMNEFD
jgi:hypothetical protein